VRPEPHRPHARRAIARDEVPYRVEPRLEAEVGQPVAQVLERAQVRLGERVARDALARERERRLRERVDLALQAGRDSCLVGKRDASVPAR
jgi:hypothetical protein